MTNTTTPSVALCADEESLRHPEIIGLAGENLLAQPWLRVFSSAQGARAALAEDRSVSEVWVASSDEVAPINLAATIKADRPERVVCMLSAQESGSLLSRASAAGIDASLSHQALSERYSLKKHQAQATAGLGTEYLGMEGESRVRGSAASPAGTIAGALPSSTPPPPGQPPGYGRGAPFPPAPPSAGGAPMQLQAAGAFGAPTHDQSASFGSLGTAKPPGFAAGSGASRSGAVKPASAPPPAAAAQVPGLCVTEGARDHAVERASPRAPAAEPAAAVRTAVFGPGTRERKPAFLLPVVSGSGGAGKSTVAVLLALISQGLGRETLLIDFDLQFGDVACLLGEESPLRIDEAIAVPARLTQLKARDGKPALIAAPKRLESAEEVAAQAGTLLDSVSERFDVIVANTGSAWAEEHAVLLERGTRSLFLIDQRPSSLSACRHALELCARCGIAATPFVYALNRCAKSSLVSSMDVSCALRGASVFELRDGGHEVEELVGSGSPLELVRSRNDLCLDVEKLLTNLLPGEDGRPSGTDGGKGAGIGSLFGKRSRKRRR